MDYQLMFPGRFLKSVEFKGQRVTLTITTIKIEEIDGGQKGPETKGIVSFAETKKQWVINRTNAECLKTMFGRKTEGWVGKRVTLWPAPYTDHTSGEATTAIRVFGSPDIAADMTAIIALARKKPFPMPLKKVGPQQNGKAAPAPAAQSSEPPPFDDSDMPPEAA